MASLSSIQPPLLTCVVSFHRDMGDVLRFHRLCRSFHRLLSDAAWCAAAWRHATVDMDMTESTENELQRLVDAALSDERYITVPAAGLWPATRRMTLSQWQEAATTLTAACQRWLDERAQLGADVDMHNLLGEGEEYRVEQVQKLLDLIRTPPQTETVTDATSKHVEVVKGVDSRDVCRFHESPSVISRRILRSTPHLHSLSLTIDLIFFDMPAISASIGLVPHLRSLHVKQSDSDQTNTEDSILDINAALDALPHLTALHCEQLHVAIADLLRIAAHSTLRRITIECDNDVAYLDTDWLGYSFNFLASDQTDASSDSDSSDSDSPAEVDDADEAEAEDEKGGMSEAEALATEQRLLTALSRTQPTLKSVQLRLALIQQVHRKVSRRSLRSGFNRPMSLLWQYRRQTRLVRSTLQQQYERLASSDAVDVVDAALSLPSAKRVRLEQSGSESAGGTNLPASSCWVPVTLQDDTEGSQKSQRRASF